LRSRDHCEKIRIRVRVSVCGNMRRAIEVDLKVQRNGAGLKMFGTCGANFRGTLTLVKPTARSC